jgi:hypothetical protein
MTSLVLRDLILESLTPGVNAPLDDQYGDKGLNNRVPNTRCERTYK